MPGVTYEGVWSVLKWVLLVLAAGFIGQFGKFLATRIIERRRDTGSQQVEPMHPSDAQTAIETSQFDALAKIEKKRAKSDIKRAKKSSKS